MKRENIYIAFALTCAAVVILVALAHFFPSEFRTEEIKMQREITISDRFIAGATLNGKEESYLKERKYAYLVSEIQRIYWRDKGAGYKLFTRAVALGVDSPMIYAELADLCVARNESQQAIALLEKAVASKSGLDSWMINSYVSKLADLYYNQKKYPFAAKYYERFLLVNPRNTDVLFKLSFCYVKMQELDKAMDLLDRCMKINPASPYISDVHCLRGEVYESKGSWSEAEQSYNASLRLNPRNKVAETNLRRVESTAKTQKL
ncbi:MAG: tetratricopeptide repeat protein [Candidatus Omnitrophota bacterium]